MRLTDIVIVIPIIVVGAVVGSAVGGLGPLVLAIFLGFFAWTGIARLVRAEFLSLREREFVEAARVAGASDARIIFKHILPNAMGVVIVATTLLDRAPRSSWRRRCRSSATASAAPRSPSAC